MTLDGDQRPEAAARPGPNPVTHAVASSSVLAGPVVPGGPLDDDAEPVERIDEGDERDEGGELIVVEVLAGVAPRLVADPTRRVGDPRALLGQLLFALAEKKSCRTVAASGWARTFMRAGTAGLRIPSGRRS